MDYSKSLNQSLTLENIHRNIYNVAKNLFTDCSINFYSLNPHSKKIESTLFNQDLWPIPKNTIRWLSSHILLENKTTPHLYIHERSTFILTDFIQFKLDQKKYNFNCNDGLFIKISKHKDTLYGILFIHKWHQKKSLLSYFPNLDSTILKFSNKINPFIDDISNLYIEKKIKTLLLSKQTLKSRLNEDEASLKKKILELQTMFETSTELSHTLNHQEIIKKISKSVKKVIDYNFIGVYISDIFNKNELYVTQSHNFERHIIDQLIYDILDCSKLFFSSIPNPDKLSISLYKISYKNYSKPITQILTFSTIPLIYQSKIIGLITISGFTRPNFTDSQQQFLNTISNNLASTLGKIKIIRNLEKSKIYSVIESIREPILIMDEKHHVHILNPEAKKLLNTDEEDISKKSLLLLIDQLGLLSLFNRVKATKKAIINQEATYNQKNFLVSISPITNKDHGYVGVVILFRDVSQLHQMNRITTQQLNAISQVNNIINSIQKPNELLKLLMKFLLDTTNCNMGSIQLKKNNIFVTSIHTNFPEKIRKSYRFINKKSISDVVSETKKPLLIDNYFSHADLDKNVKILIELYLCIPVIINNKLIGIINLLRKYGTTATPFTAEDFDTLLKISSIVATAIHNSMLYNEKIEKEKIDQELKLATKIHQNLLTKDLPILPEMSFGVLNIPARKLGGDFYDIVKFKNDKIAIIIADIVGKGIPAGLYMAVLKSIIHRHVSKFQPPKTILAQLSNVIYEDPVINTFIPIFIGIFDFKNKSFSYSNAGHEPAFLIRNKKFIKCQTTDLPIGSFAKQTFTEKSIDLQYNDIFFGFTDGMIDLKNEKNNPIKVEGIKKFLLKNIQFPPEIICTKLENYINSISSNNDKKDDITTVICKYKKNKISTQKLIINKEIISSSNLKEIKRIRHLIKEFCITARYSNKTIFDIQLSVNEAQANIIEHGYLGDNEKPILFKFNIFSEKIIIVIKDFGLKHHKHIDQYYQANSIDTSEGSGLGVFLIYSLMDEVKYETSDMYNKLTLVKYNLKSV